MINFIICKDKDTILKKYKEEINNFMMNYDTEYKIHCYKNYNDKWKTYAQKEDGFKVYILDTEDEQISNISAARLIREDYDDWNSIIIILSSLKKSNYQDHGKRLMLIDLTGSLNKSNDSLSEILSICMKHYDKRPKILRYTYKNIIYNIEFRQILYIEKELDSKICKINTTTGEYYIQGSINDILKKLDNRFIKCYRSIIINLEQIESYDIKDNIIVFKNKKYLESISRTKRKEVLNHIRGIR